MYMRSTQRRTGAPQRAGGVPAEVGSSIPYAYVYIHTYIEYTYRIYETFLLDVQKEIVRPKENAPRPHFGMDIEDAVETPRFHHQWLPDVIQLEFGFSPDTISELQRRGHTLRGAKFTIGSVHSVAWRDGYFLGAADPRRPGGSSVGPTMIRN